MAVLKIKLHLNFELLRQNFNLSTVNDWFSGKIGQSAITVVSEKPLLPVSTTSHQNRNSETRSHSRKAIFLEVCSTINQCI